MKRAKKEHRPKATKISISMPEPVYRAALTKTRDAGEWNFSQYLRRLVEQDLKAA